MSAIVCRNMEDAPLKTERITVRFNEPDMAAIEAYAEDRRLDPSDVVRMGTMAFLASEGKLHKASTDFVQLLTELKAEYRTSKKKPTSK